MKGHRFGSWCFPNRFGPPLVRLNRPHVIAEPILTVTSSPHPEHTSIPSAFRQASSLRRAPRPRPLPTGVGMR